MTSAIKKFIKQFPDAAKHAISGVLKGLGRAAENEVYTFDEIDSKYNRGISTQAKEAWVWYQKKVSPMTGWGKYDKIKTEADTVKYVQEGFLFYSEGELVPYPVYCQGNMYDKELELEKNRAYILENYGEKAVKAHENAIKGAKPKLLSFADPLPDKRPKLLAYSKFAKEYMLDKDAMGLDKYLSLTDYFVDVFLPTAYEEQKVLFDIFSPRRIDLYYIQKSSFPHGTDEATKDYYNQYLPLVAEKLFSNMLFSLPYTERQKLDIAWNRTFNAYSSLKYSEIPIGFQCSKKFKKGEFEFSEIQKEGIAFMQAAKSGILGYDVGVGKTITAIITLINEMYAGRIKRPIIIVPNQTYKKWIMEIFGDETQGVAGVATGLNIKLNDWFNLGGKYSKLPPQKGKVNENTITIITVEGLAKLGYSPQLRDGQLFDTLQEILFQPSDNPNDKRDPLKEINRYLEILGQGNKGVEHYFDELGFDYLVCDEAHNFKSLFKFIPTDKGGKKRFNMGGGESSTRAIKLFFFANYLQETYGRNVMLLTATPFTNNPLEIYSMLSYVAWDRIKSMGYKNIYNFVETFVLETHEYVNSYDGGIEVRPVVKAFNNKAVLQRLIRNVINYKTGDEAGVKRPFKINYPTITKPTDSTIKLPKNQQLHSFLTMTPLQSANQKAIESFPDRFNGFDRIRAVMKSLSWNLDNALSPYIYSKEKPKDAKEFVEGSPKIHYACLCIKSVKEYHEKNGTSTSGQVIYMNRGVEYFPLLKEYLETEVGYKKGVKFGSTKIDEVEFIHAKIEKGKRELIKEAFLAGVCKIVVGTSSIKEGIDLQKNGTVLYNLYLDWNPTDMIQLEGRVYRQGNDFQFVRIVNVLVQDTMDVFIYQKLTEKVARLADIWSYDDLNQVTFDGIDPDEIKFALYTNLAELVKIEVEKQERVVKNKIITIEGEIKSIAQVENSIKDYRRYRKEIEDACIASKEPLLGFEKLIEIYKSKWESYGDAKLKSYVERAMDIVLSINDYQENPDDKKLIGIWNSLNGSIFDTKNVIELPSYYIGDKYKSAFSELAKAQNGFFQRTGYSMDTDLASILAEKQMELEKAKKENENIRKPENLQKLYDVVRAKKEANAIVGKNPYDATDDFEKLNHLLSYPYDRNATYTYETIPKEEFKGVVGEKTAPKINILKLKAKALKLKLKLLAA